MRLLFLTNFYPPYSFGGMEISCQAVVDALARRGHEVRVLTSTHGPGTKADAPHVARRLNLEMSLEPLRHSWESIFLRRQHEKQNRSILREEITQWAPDVLFVWGMWNFHRVLAQDAEQLMKGRVLYRFGDYWPTLPSQHIQYWQASGRRPITTLAKRMLAPIALSLLDNAPQVPLSFPYSYCVSERVKKELLEHKVPIHHSSVIHTGFELSAFTRTSVEQKWSTTTPHRLLFLGRLTPEKGLHIAIEALRLLVQAEKGKLWELTIAGAGNGSYVDDLKKSIHDYGLQDRVTFTGYVPAESVPCLLEPYGTVVVPSTWQDPLPRTAIEAMAGACVVVASAIGGLPEIIEHEKTGLLFLPGDPSSLALALAQLEHQPRLVARMVSNARATALSRFHMPAMLDRIEQLLEQVIINASCANSEIVTQ